ncbi:iron chaperone [uncultured Roseibium sp.]|uniref:iron chaperone n=1 Tax=uncultured Roseibium sp. TaxID=1936171 RepID=UPI0026373222|nr:DUF1801 domain-containing protein [uncultured Roseibium sp.]
MQYEASDPQDYLRQLDDDWRRQGLLELRELILASDPEIRECIHYKMLGYTLGDDFVCHLNAQKHYVSLYVGDAAKIDPDGALLNGLSVGKGCIRFSKSKSRHISDGRIEAFLKRAIEMKREGADLGC